MADFLTHLTIENPGSSDFPFSLPLLQNGLKLEFKNNLTFIIGENGSGKSTLLEAIAEKCEYNLSGGNKNHLYQDYRTEAGLYNHTRLGWRKKPYEGFFLRAESFYNFARHIDELAQDSPSVLRAYGDKSLHHQSHGEAFLSLFSNKLDRGFFILDEPEAALSPMRQLSLISIIKELLKNGQVQFIIATHSPILLCIENADILQINGGNISKITYEECEHYKFTKSFLNNPESYLKHL